jgi:hypothetical protein
MEPIKLDVYPEICCDICDEIIHNHINCPVCKVSYASTTTYGDLYDFNEVECEECGAIFEKINPNDSWYNGCSVRIKFDPNVKLKTKFENEECGDNI